jgi:S-adenosylmethionine decarboxylase
MVGFGPHLIYEGKGCPVHKLTDLGLLYRFLDELPERIHMTRIMPPYVFRHGAPGPLQGLSGFVLIAESHISLHTFPEHRRVSADVFSCLPFDTRDALAELARTFSAHHAAWKVLDRGTEFPKSIGGARALVERERHTMARSMGLEVPR